MNVCFIQVYLLGTLSTYFYLANTMSLDMYCANVTGGKYEYSSHTTLQKYLRICRDVNTYFGCIKNYRLDKRVHKDVTIMPYELSFPKMEDLQRATYWFCLLDLFKFYLLLNYQNITCERKINESSCHEKHENVELLSWLQRTLKTSPLDELLVSKLSCSIVAPLTDCIQQQYVACNEDFDIFRQYEMAKLGVDCLQSQNLVSTYTHRKVCGSAGINFLWKSIQTLLLNVLMPVVVLGVCSHGELWNFE